jgi:hypothetical protein
VFVAPEEVLPVHSSRGTDWCPLGIPHWTCQSIVWDLTDFLKEVNQEVPAFLENMGRFAFASYQALLTIVASFSSPSVSGIASASSPSVPNIALTTVHDARYLQPRVEG